MNINQIAMKAADLIAFRLSLKESVEHAVIVSEVKAAIEKATAEDLPRNSQRQNIAGHKAAEAELRAAHASEPWTIERIEQIMRNDPSTWKSALAFELNALTRAAHASETDPNAAKMIERAQELVDMEEYPNL